MRPGRQANAAELQAAFLLPLKSTGGASHVLSAPQAPVDRQYNIIRVEARMRRVWPHALSSLRAQGQRCVHLNEGLVSTEGGGVTSTSLARCCHGCSADTAS